MRRMSRRMRRRRLIEDIKFALKLGVVVYSIFGGMFMYWLIFGY